MSKSGSSRRVSLSSDQKPTTTTSVPIRTKKRLMTVFWVFRLPKSPAGFSPESFLRRLGAKVAKVLRYVSFKKRSPSSNSKNAASASASASSNFKRSHSVSDSMEESHRAEAVKDCIHFFNNSSSSSSL